MNKTEYYKTVKGYAIRVYDKEYKRNLYVKSYRNGHFSLVTDYTFAKGYTLKTAKKHAQTLKFYDIWGA